MKIPRSLGFGATLLPTWVWVKIKPPGIGPQVLVLGSIYQALFWVQVFEPQPHEDTEVARFRRN